MADTLTFRKAAVNVGGTVRIARGEEHERPLFGGAFVKHKKAFSERHLAGAYSEDLRRFFGDLDVELPCPISRRNCNASDFSIAVDVTEGRNEKRRGIVNGRVLYMVSWGVDNTREKSYHVELFDATILWLLDSQEDLAA